MKTLKIKELLLVLIMVIVVVVTMVGCGKTKSSAGETAENERDDNFNATGYPIVKEKITLKGFGNQNVTHKDWAELDCFNIYEEKSNIHIEWTTAPNAGYLEKKNILLASGEYPDIFYRAGLTVSDQVNYGSKGLFLPLNDLINDYAPNLKERFTELEELEKVITMPDGNIYSLPAKTSVYQNSAQYSWINADWVANVGMEMPKTLDELKTLFMAFKEQDANDNGDPNDELPYSDRSKGDALFWSLNAAFGMGNLGARGFDSYIDLDKEGNVRCLAATDNYKAKLEYIKDLYANGLIDPETFTQDIPTFTAKGEQNIIGAFFHNGSPEIIGSSQDDNFEAMPPLTNIYGKQSFNYIDPLAGSGAFALSSTNEYPRESMRWIDYYYGEEGGTLIRLGVEGLTYIDNGDGTFALTELIKNNPDGLNVPQSMGQYAIGFAGGGCPEFARESHEKARLSPVSWESYEVVKDHIDLETSITFLFTVEEQNRLNALTADIVKYIDEMRIQFVTNKASFDEWDDYIETLNKMGLEEYVEIHQASYDRWVL